MATTYSVPGAVIVDIAGHTDNAQDLVIQPDGSVLVAGFSNYSDDLDEGTDFSLVHLHADGSVDTGYGHGGRQVIHKQIPFGKDYTLQVQADGAVVTAHQGHDDTPIVQRWGADGKADASFDRNAEAALPSGLGYAPLMEANADGTVMVGAVNGTTVQVTQLNSDGTLDTSFGAGGQLSLQAPSTLLFLESMTALDDGGILVHGAPSAQNSLLKFTADGQLDASFGDNGVVSLPSSGSYRGGVTVQDDGKILVARTTSFEDFAVLRFNADGGLDDSFGNGGLISLDLPGDFAQASSIALLDDGKILLSGNTYTLGGSDFATVRLNADGSLDTTFGSPNGGARLVGTSGNDELRGLDSDETLRGLAGDDLLQGNEGRDLLSGGTGSDTFRYASLADSFRTATTSHSDRILDFDPNDDRIDLSALGFTGLGNGYDGTLALRSDAGQDRTYLKSFEANADGQRFELVLENSSLAGQLDGSNLVFSAPEQGSQAELVALGVGPIGGGLS